MKKRKKAELRIMKPEVPETPVLQAGPSPANFRVGAAGDGQPHSIQVRRTVSQPVAVIFQLICVHLRGSAGKSLFCCSLPLINPASIKGQLQNKPNKASRNNATCCKGCRYGSCQANGGKNLNMPKTPESVQWRTRANSSTPSVVPRSAGFAGQMGQTRGLTSGGRPC